MSILPSGQLKQLSDAVGMIEAAAIETLKSALRSAFHGALSATPLPILLFIILICFVTYAKMDPMTEFHAFSVFLSLTYMVMLINWKKIFKGRMYSALGLGLVNTGIGGLAFYSGMQLRVCDSVCF